MRLPTSVVVMSLITAVPFGLAIRDTIRHPAANEDALDFDGSRARAREAAAAQARWEQAQRAAEAEHAAARARAIGGIYGAAPASLGHLFDGVVLGADAQRARAAATSPALLKLEDDADIQIDLGSGSGRLDDITVSLGDSCDDLATQLRTAWGASETETWRAPDGQRAHLDDDTCTLTFDRAADAAAWLDRTAEAIVPLGEIGRPASDLHGRGGIDPDDAEGVAMWKERGLGAGDGPTQLSVNVEDGKIVAITAEVDTDPASIEAVEARLTSLLHGDAAIDDTGLETWKGPPQVTLEIDGEHLRLVAGAQP